MATERGAVVFDEDSIKNAVACAMLMSYIDGDVDDRERAVIRRFVNAYWKDEYRDYKQVKAEIDEQISPFIIDSAGFQSIISELVDNLTKDMTPPQRTFLLKLVNDVMMADGVMKPREARLFEMFTERLHIR